MRLAPIVGFALLVLGSLARGAEARDCRDETPLPADVRLIVPGADVPPDAARFAGAWVGPWKTATGDIVCGTLVVEEVLPTGHARVVYSRGTWEPIGDHHPAYWRATGRVVDGELRFALPISDRPPMAYRFTGDALSGTFRGRGNHAVTGLADVASIGCRQRFSPDRAPPARSGPRDRLTAAELLSSSASGPLHHDYFLPVGPSMPARHALRGTIRLTAQTTSHAREGCLGLTVPTPGRIWSEPGDQGMSRASFPFVHGHELGNFAHNGVATFLFDDTRVTSVRFQIGQETAPGSDLVDYWGAARATYTAEGLELYSVDRWTATRMRRVFTP